MNTPPSIPQFIKLFQTMEQKGVTLELLQDRFATGALADVLDPGAKIDRPALRVALGLPGLGVEAFPGATLTPFGALDVDLGLTLEQMIAAGRYDWVNGDIVKSGEFKPAGDGVLRLEAALLGFDRNVSSEAAIKTAGSIDAERPWQVAGISALCAFGAKHPDEQRKKWIVGLGSVGQVRGHRLVPVLYRDDAERNLRLRGWVGDWNDCYRFLLVRNASASVPQAST